MNKSQWLDYFSQINSRKPSPEEIDQALQNGEFVEEVQESDQSGAAPLDASSLSTEPVPVQTGAQTQSVQPTLLNNSQGMQLAHFPRKTKKLAWFLALGLILLALFLGLGGYSTYRYTSANLEGTYEVVYTKEYETNDVENFEKLSENSSRIYATVDAHKEIQLFDQVVDEVDDVSDDIHSDYPSIDIASYFKTPLKVDQWHHKIIASKTPAAYEASILSDLKKLFPDMTKAERQNEAETYVDPFKNISGKDPKHAISYEKSGDQVTVHIAKTSGKKVMTLKFKKLSPAKADKVSKQYRKDLKNFENYARNNTTY